MIDQYYHFPNIYLRAAQQCLGDWIVYRETGRDGGRMAYIAVARLAAIEPDPQRAGFHYGHVSDFLMFDRPVPYRDSNGRFAEHFLREGNPATAGRALRGQSVRGIDQDDFAAIVDAGLADVLAPANAVRLELDPAHLDGATTALLADSLTERRVEQMLVNRKIRDAAFRLQVLDAYDSTCAVTRLRIINGGGKAEAQAAHILSVADSGPDIVQNGIALSATAHWLFDRHLISLTDNYELLVSHNKVPSELRELFPAHGQTIHLPKAQALWPRHDFMARHRERFAGAGM